ncbi:MAG: hypothetical protein ACE5JX_02040 [Acidobacteriota bacterium]
MLDAGWHNPETPGSHYGFGLFVYDGGKSFGNGGLWPGYRTHVTHYVPTGTTIAVQTNRDGRLDMEALVTRIAALVPSP